MKKINLVVIAIFLVSQVFAQGVTAKLSVTANRDLTRYVGSKQTIKVTIRNNADYAYVIGKSEYAVLMTYQGSTNVGKKAFNNRLKLPKTLPAGKSVTYTIAMAVPLEAGEYEVDFSFVWGNRVISNVVTINFEIKPNYRVRLECSKTSIKWAADTDIEIKVKNEGDMTWPEGRYSLEFDLSHAPSGAKTADLRCFDIKPRVVETWEGFESGNYDAILIRDFKLPATKGDYRVKVYLLKDGKRFQASGNPKEFTFRIN